MINDEADSQLSLCADLLSLKSTEGFPYRFLTHHQTGEWVAVKPLCEAIGINHAGMTDALVVVLVVVWLPNPDGDQSFVVIVFLDSATMESMAAYFNVAWLLRSKFGDHQAE